MGFCLPFFLVGKNRQHDFGCAKADQTFLDGGERHAFIENVVNHQHRAALDRGPRRHAPGDFSSLRFRAVARRVEVVEIERKIELGQQLTAKDHTAGHHAEHQGIFLGQTLANGTGHLNQRALNGRF